MTAVVSAPILDQAPDLERCFLFDEVEDSYEMPAYSGYLPKWLKGSWYINGPARFERAGRRHSHWLDGDGMVCALHFGRNGLRFVNRFVRTAKWVAEEAAGRFLYRGFGTAFSGDLLRRNVMLESPVNVSIYHYGTHLLAFGEQTLPYELDPLTIETRGEFDFGGALNTLSPFSAHAKMDRGLLNFGVSFSANQPMLNTYEFDDFGALARRRYKLNHQYSVHDFGFTHRHLVFFLSPLLMKFERFRNDGVSILDALSWEPELGARILVAPRRGCTDQVFTIEAGGGYCLHVINCFETDIHLIVDVLLMDAPVYPEYRPLPHLFATAPCGRPVRYIVDLKTYTVSTCRIEGTCSPDFPSVDPSLAGRMYSDFWMLDIPEQRQPGRKFFTRLSHGSWDQGSVFDNFKTSKGQYLCGEPCFVSNPADPCEAVVVCQRFRPADDAADIVLFDAFQVRRGPIASLPLNRPVHPGFHSTFVSTEGDMQ